MRKSAVSVVAAVVTLAAAPVASADLADETALAEKYAPVVRLVEQKEECGPGEPYEPIDVDVLFDEPTVALRGPWNAVDLVKIAPTARDLAGLYEYHLDFPGNALDPGCSFERWGRRITEGSVPTVYTHVATERARPGKLALQYWLYYVYNDWNNLHEGDWEMVQLVFDAPDARAALEQDPTSIGYSQHEGAERADWGDDKLELVDGHPVVHPAAGSHANFYDEALFIGSSGDEGVGCDDTRGPTRELSPDVRTIPSDVADAQTAFPWIGFEGRWGELQRAFFNGPTGPNLKTQWTEPITWSETWRDRAFAVPTGGILGTDATDFFCGAISKGSVGLIQLISNPATTLLALGALLALVLFAAWKATWRPTAPLRVGRRRSWGQIISASGRMYVGRAGLFLGIGLILIPVTALTTVLQAVFIGGLGLVGLDASGESAGALAIVVLLISATLTLFAFAFVQAATACAVQRIDEGRPVSPLSAYGIAVEQLRPLLGASAIAAGIWIVLTATAFLLPVAIWIAVRWALFAQAVELEGRSAAGALARSTQLVRGHWLRVASLVGVGSVVTLAAGPVLGTLLILATDLPLALLNLVAGVVYAAAMPFVALTTTYVYFDTRTRHELEPEEEPEELPAELGTLTA